MIIERRTSDEALSIDGSSTSTTQLWLALALWVTHRSSHDGKLHLAATLASHASAVPAALRARVADTGNMKIKSIPHRRTLLAPAARISAVASSGSRKPSASACAAAF